VSSKVGATVVAYAYNPVDARCTRGRTTLACRAVNPIEPSAFQDLCYPKLANFHFRSSSTNICNNLAKYQPTDCQVYCTTYCIYGLLSISVFICILLAKKHIHSQSFLLPPDLSRSPQWHFRSFGDPFSGFSQSKRMPRTSPKYSAKSHLTRVARSS
jgi:hypothetical protein